MQLQSLHLCRNIFCPWSAELSLVQVLQHFMYENISASVKPNLRKFFPVPEEQ